MLAASTAAPGVAGTRAAGVPTDCTAAGEDFAPLAAVAVFRMGGNVSFCVAPK